MGCISVTPQCCRNTDEQEQEDLVQIPSIRHTTPPVSGREAASAPELDKLIGPEKSQHALSDHLLEDRLEELSGVELLWGKSRRDLEKIICTEPIIGWEGEDIRSLGEIVWSSSAVLQDKYTQEESRRHLVLFPLHLLILAVNDEEQRFIYQGLLPLSGISVRMLVKNTFEVTGSMFDSRIIICPNEEEFRIWMAHLPRRVKKASLYRAHKQHKLAMLIPCDEAWKRQELEKYLLQNPIQGWEGTPIQHMGDIIYLSMVQVSFAQSQRFEERIMVLFLDDLIILSTDEQKTAVQYEGRLPTQSIRALERSARVGHLEFEITGEMMEPVKVSCAKPSEYKKWFFHLQKPDYSTNTLPFNQQLPPRLPKKRRSCHY
ncbi:probable pleckstrin homology domain-containing family N member 1 isoform X1 [Pristis pectinata]|uniref:probable pleckstrin homology domain-containing family N member 1 isoform X1 n=1 Tax=Pristis pectinata TaxID=685728 RepID=UPI00223D6050|nr:probable pleckstrin homology domain-containing family N member 1 isoform X1 [Pristis pectinata]